MFIQLFFLSTIALLIGQGTSKVNNSSGLKERMIVDENSCVTPDEEAGICVTYSQCPALKSLAQGPEKIDPSTEEFLQRSLCNFLNNEPIVCCPLNSSDVNTVLFDELPDPPECGKAIVEDSPRIVGGRLAKRGSWPWIGAIGYLSLKGSDKVHYSCGGTLITDSFVLTAAHCDASNVLIIYSFRMGVLNIYDDPEATPVDKLVLDVFNHPEYDDVTNKNDISLLKIDQVTFTDYIRPICLPKTEDMLIKSYEDYNVLVAGWGTIGYREKQSTDLRQVQVPVIPNSQCQQSFNRFIQITNTHLCAGFANGGKDACQGDSGGPLVLTNADGAYLIGVVSIGYKCALPGYPGVYTRVTNYVKWISETIRSHM